MKKALVDTLSRIRLRIVEVRVYVLDPPFILTGLLPGGNLNAASRQALMQKLARTESSSVQEETL